MATGSNYEDLRKRARQLETEIDTKLVNLNKLGVCLGTNRSRFDVGFTPSSSAEMSPLLPSYSPALSANIKANFDSLCTEIEQSLAKLTEVNDQLSEMLHNDASSAQSNPALLHTLRRHRDILRDYSNEFQRTRANIKNSLEREELLGAEDDDNDLNKSGGLNRRTDAYLKEHEHSRSSNRMIDEQIQIAIATKENMTAQRIGFRDITRKINTITTERYPAVNSLMHKIQFKKRKDTLVLAAVISVCLILMFLYVSN